MAAPASIQNTRSQSTDTLYGADGTPRGKLGIGSKQPSGQTAESAWLAAATHVDGATFVASDGVAAIAGVDGSTVRKLLVDALGRPLVVLVPTQGTLTDRSGTITTGGTAQSVAASLTTRKYFLFQNHSDTVMWINFGATAVADQPSIKVDAGAGFTFEGSFCSNQSVSVICATTGKKFTAKEG